MTAPANPLILGLGELLWDVFPDSRRPGGAPANVAFHAGQLGGRGTVVSRVGRDPLGDELLAWIASEGLAVEAIQRDPHRPTSTVSVDLSRRDQPRYTIHENVAWDGLEFDETLAQLASRADAICFGSLAQRSPVSRETIQRVIRAAGPGCLIVFDVNLRQHYYDRAGIEASLAAARVVKLNSDEVAVLDQLLEIGAGDETAFARAVQQRFGPETVCVTRAERGSLLVGRNEAIEAPGVAVQVADAVGAGDAFTAALIVAQLRGWPLAAQAALANQVGAMVAARHGAMPRLREEFQTLLASFDG
jgi:fructokinase